MPPQALIRNLNAEQVKAEIDKLSATDLLDVTASADNELLLCCKTDGDGTPAGAAKALQAIVDIDSVLTRQKATEIKAAEKIAADAKAKAKN